MRNLFAAIGVISVFGPGTAFAWGSAGHAIVAEIAEDRLTPAVAAEVQRLLALENHQQLDQVANWADQWRQTDPQTGNWHFVDILLDAAAYDQLETVQKALVLLPR